jgi:hypothetical protein
MKESFEEMFKVLKYDRWLSLVFAHKDASYWNAIVEGAKDAGFKYVNTVPQSPQTIWSVHKKKNPTTVLAGNLILNFRKTTTPTSIAITNVGSDAVQIMKNTAEVVMVRNGGSATTDEVINEIVVKLLENGLLGEVKTKIGDIAPILQEHFLFSEIDELWHIPKDFQIGHFIAMEDRIKFYLTDYLNRAARQSEPVSFDKIINNVLPQLINGKTPETQTILGVLREIAYSPNGTYWELKPTDTTISSQLTLFSEESIIESPIPKLFAPITEDNLTHNSIVYRLAKLGAAAGYKIWIGKKEQSEIFNSQRLSDLSIDQLPDLHVDEYDRGKIEQIDVLWLDGSKPVFAFEVEHSTTIISGIQRFMALLNVDSQIAGNLVLLAPSKRRNKLNNELTNSAFIGHPLYMETKISYVFYDDFISMYDSLANSSYRKHEIDGKLRAILRRPKTTK